MKKIALLFTILCAGALNGSHYTGMDGLPKRTQTFIIQVLNNFDDLDDAIQWIKMSSKADKELNEVVNKRNGNQKGFAELVDMISNKFDINTKLIAIQFGTPAAKKYIRDRRSVFKSTPGLLGELYK